MNAGRERKLIDVHWNVARAAWIGIVAPRSTGFRFALHNGEILDAGAHQLDARADAAVPGSYHYGALVFRHSQVVYTACLLYTVACDRAALLLRSQLVKSVRCSSSRQMK